MPILSWLLLLVGIILAVVALSAIAAANPDLFMMGFFVFIVVAVIMGIAFLLYSAWPQLEMGLTTAPAPVPRPAPCCYYHYTAWQPMLYYYQPYYLQPG